MPNTTLSRIMGRELTSTHPPTRQEDPGLFLILTLEQTLE